MESLKISIITISYNAAKTIEDTIKSVEAQRYDNLEYIIVDSKSNDGTIDIVNQYSSIVSKVICEKDKGISDAFNKGICVATGDIIGIINADDILCENALHNLVKYYQKDIDVYRGKIYKWNSDSGRKVEIFPSMDLIPHGQKIVIAHPGTFVTRVAYQKYGMYDLKCRTMMDYELLIRFAQRGAKFKYVPEFLSCFRIGGITTDNSRVLKNTPAEIKERRYVLAKSSISKPIIAFELLKTVAKNVVKFGMRTE